MNIVVRFWFLIAVVMQLGCSHLATRPVPNALAPAEFQRLQQQINMAIQQINPHVSVGMEVVSLVNHKTVYSKNRNQLFTPASTLKVVTAAAALYYLGAHYRFATKLLATQVNGQTGRLQDLYLVGSGDPTLTWNHLMQLANELKQRGVRVISGDVVVDDSAFDNLLWGKGWMWDDRSVAYSAPIEAVNCNGNRLTLRIVPAQKAGKPARVLMTPPTQFVNIQTHVTTGRPTAARHISFRVMDPRFPNARDLKQGLQSGQTIVLEGTLPQTGQPRTLHFAVSEPSLFTGTVLRELLQAQGIRVKGAVRRASAVPCAQQLAVHRSVSLREMLVDVLRTSNNHATEILLKTLGQHTQQTQQATGDFAGGIRAVERFLQQGAGIEPKKLHIADGSGLSRYSLMTPRQMTRLLAFMWHEFSLQPDFVGCLPALKNSQSFSKQPLSQPQHARHVRAKTGSMGAVSNLAGYMVTQQGDPLAFTIFINGFLGSKQPYRKLKQQLLTILYHVPKIAA
ncbi:MAG: D-alanyl-D-alanine carboxypeptidase/D-alanyl-D-alanine-endopeptidase [Myxococcota bacterium]